MFRIRVLFKCLRRLNLGLYLVLGFRFKRVISLLERDRDGMGI